MEVFAVLPALNEEDAIGGVISKIKELGIVDGIIVIDGHSTDKSVEIAKKHGVHIIVQDGKGKGAGFKTFLKKGKIQDSAIYIMLDADASYDPADIPQVLEGLERGGADVVSGYRKPKLMRIGVQNVFHFFGNKLISLVGFVLFGKWTDICTGYWGFRGSALKELDIEADGFDLEADIFANVCKKRISYAHVPVSHRKRTGERKLKSTDAIIIIKRLFQERFSH